MKIVLHSFTKGCLYWLYLFSDHLLIKYVCASVAPEPPCSSVGSAFFLSLYSKDTTFPFSFSFGCQSEPKYAFSNTLGFFLFWVASLLFPCDYLQSGWPLGVTETTWLFLFLLIPPPLHLVAKIYSVLALGFFFFLIWDEIMFDLPPTPPKMMFVRKILTYFLRDLYWVILWKMTLTYHNEIFQ